MGCRKTLIRDVQGDKVPEQMFIKYIHGDVKLYEILWAQIEIGDQEI